MKKHLAAAAATVALAAAVPAGASATTFAGSCHLAGAASTSDTLIAGIVDEQIEQSGSCSGSVDGGPLRSHPVSYSENLHGLRGPPGIPTLGHGQGLLVFARLGRQLSLRVEHASLAVGLRGADGGSGVALITSDAGGVKSVLFSLGTFAG
jgi:hypothetical protein